MNRAASSWPAARPDGMWIERGPKCRFARQPTCVGERFRPHRVSSKRRGGRCDGRPRDHRAITSPRSACSARATRARGLHLAPTRTARARHRAHGGDYENHHPTHDHDAWNCPRPRRGGVRFCDRVDELESGGGPERVVQRERGRIRRRHRRAVDGRSAHGERRRARVRGSVERLAPRAPVDLGDEQEHADGVAAPSRGRPVHVLSRRALHARGRRLRRRQPAALLAIGRGRDRRRGGDHLVTAGVADARLGHARAGERERAVRSVRDHERVRGDGHARRHEHHD